MFLDIAPLRNNTSFRRLFASQVISGLGTMVCYVAVPWQLYQLTHSNAQVGLLGLVQLLPVVVCGLLGGAVADRVGRKRLLMTSEALMALCLAGLLANALAAAPSALTRSRATAVRSSLRRPCGRSASWRLALHPAWRSVSCAWR